MPARPSPPQPTARSRRRVSAGVAAALLVALVVRLVGLDWGLPRVAEEATPLRTAWSMGGWGTEDGFDPNPRFFHYPTLTIHVHLLALAVEYAVLRATGAVATGTDFAVRWLAEPVPFFLVGRAITVAFALAGVVLAARLAARLASGGTAAAAATIAAFLVALDPLHVAHSQQVGVDVPLATLVTLALVLAVRAAERPTAARFAAAGIAVGLAASAKYTGALAFLPILAAFAVARIGARAPDSARPSARLPFVAAAAALAAFLATSPFVALDFPRFLAHWRIETEHMRAGHFGRGEEVTAILYGRSLLGRTVGPVALALAALALLRLAGRERRTPAWVVLAFVGPYLAVVASWAMHADRYLLPVVPALLALAATELARLRPPLGRRSRAARIAVGACGIVIVAATLARGWSDHVARLRPGGPALAAAWIEANVPAGSFVATDPGVVLTAAPELWELSPDVRRGVLARRGAPVYAMQTVPMFQVRPERSAPYYDAGLWEIADVLVSVGEVRRRYAADPRRFAAQTAFARQLAERWERAAAFGPPGRETIVYRNPGAARPFAARAESTVAATLPMLAEDTARPGIEDGFWYQLGVNCAWFGFVRPALQAQRNALRAPHEDPEMFHRIAVAIAAALVREDPAAAVRFLGVAASEAPTPEIRRRLETLADRLRRVGG